MPKPVRTEGEPHDRLTRICSAMTETLDAHPENGEGDVKAVIVLDDGKRGGIVLHGYEDDMAAMVDLLLHLKAVFEVNGKTLMIMPLDDAMRAN